LDSVRDSARDPDNPTEEHAWGRSRRADCGARDDGDGSFLELERPQADGSRRYVYRASGRSGARRTDGVIKLDEPLRLGDPVELETMVVEGAPLVIFPSGMRNAKKVTFVLGGPGRAARLCARHGPAPDPLNPARHCTAADETDGGACDVSRQAPPSGTPHARTSTRGEPRSAPSLTPHPHLRHATFG